MAEFFLNDYYDADKELALKLQNERCILSVQSVRFLQFEKLTVSIRLFS